MRSARRLVGYALTMSLLAVSVAVALPLLTGRPILSYAASGSMEPTIGVLDVFLVDPWPGELRVGDIVVFHSVRENGRAVHRIVAGDERSGWYTRGDSNTHTDQDIGEPLLTRDRVLGRVVTRADGSPIIFDDLGVPFVEARVEVAKAEKLVGGERQLLAISFLALAAVFALAGAMSAERPRVPSRLSPRMRAALRRAFPRGVRGRHLGAALLLILLASTTWAAVHARGELDVTLVVVSDPAAADGIRAAAPGDLLPREIRIGALGILPTVVVVEPGSERVRAFDETATLRPLATTTVRVEQQADAQVGLQEDDVHLWRYPAILPASAIRAMHDILPGLPYAALGLGLAGVGGAWYASLGIARLPVARMLGIREDWL